MRYKVYIAKTRETQNEVETFEVPFVDESTSFKFPNNETKLQGALSFNINYFF